MDLRVMTFNIRNGRANDGENSWPNRRHLTAQVIKKNDPDIIGLQEVYDFQLQYLLSQLPEYEFYSIGRDDGERDGEQCTILWKPDRLHLADSETFWLSDNPSEPGSATWGNRTTRICSMVTFKEGFTFLNTHLDHESSAARAKGIALILEKLPANPWIMVGDLNAEPDSEDLKSLTQSEVIRFHTASQPLGTFHNFTGKSDGEKIDHIFSSPEWSARAIQVDRTKDEGLYPSDHYPVTCQLKN
ncbi:MAG TPA: endonuclease/exonuclease/phosphatase family protein [Fimbriimonas sp.]|nr:endonuclease/exonuclease/phosphatase family protein [Fimbriimonas sp.]